MCLATPGQAGCAQPTVLSRGPQGPGTTRALRAVYRGLGSGVVLKESLLGR